MEARPREPRYLGVIVATSAFLSHSIFDLEITAQADSELSVNFVLILHREAGNRTLGLQPGSILPRIYDSKDMTFPPQYTCR